MFAVIKTGGKQYSVAAEDDAQVEKIEGEPGQIVQFGEVLVVGGDKPELGAPIVSGASVAVEVIEQGRGDEGHRLQEAPPQEFAPQARPPAGLHRGPDHRDPDRRGESRPKPAAAQAEETARSAARRTVAEAAQPAARPDSKARNRPPAGRKK